MKWLFVAISLSVFYSLGSVHACRAQTRDSVVFEPTTPSDSTQLHRHRKKKQQRAATLNDNANTSVNDSLPKKKFWSFLHHQKDKSVSTNSDPSVDSSRMRHRKSSRHKSSDTLTTLRSGESVSVAPDTLPSSRKHRHKQAKHEDEVNWDSLARANTLQRTPDQIAFIMQDTANRKMDRGDYHGAVLALDSIINYYPHAFQHMYAFYFRGKAEMAMNDNADALRDFSFFNQLDNCQSNFCADSHYNIAVLKFRDGQFDECMKNLEWVFRDTTYKNYKFGFFYRAFCKAQDGQLPAAVQDLTRFITMDGGRTYSSAEAYYWRGFYKAKLADNRGAIQDYDQTIRAYEAAVATKNGAAYMQKLIDAYIVRALAKNEIKKYDDAIADYNMVIKLNPNYALAYRLKGLAEIGKGSQDAGCLDLSRAGELGNTDAYDDIKQHCK